MTRLCPPIAENPKFEARNSKQIRNPKLRGSKRLEFRASNLELVSNFGFRASDFDAKGIGGRSHNDPAGHDLPETSRMGIADTGH